MSVTQKSWLTELFPFLVWARSYSGNDFQADLIAGVVVVFITIPQVIAYAYLAGLPAEYGLYAAIMSLAGYAAFGSCRTLAVGPAAILAMMTLEAISDQAQPGSAAYVALATKLTLVTGGLLIILRIINFGAVISFLSHSVVTGFIAASAILIIANQIPSILGISQSPGTAVDVVVPHIFTHLDSINLVVLGIAAGAMLLLWFCRHQLEGILLRTGLSARLVTNLVKSAPMYAVVLSVLCVWWLSLADTRAVAVVGAIPDTWPALSMVTMTLTELQRLLPSALLIAMVIFMESTSIGSAVASKSRQKIEPNQELVGLGVANLATSLTGGFPVAGSFARTVVNYSAGAVTPVASLITCLLLLVTIQWFTEFFFYLPKGVLSAIIVMSAIQLIDLHAIRKIFTFNRIDAVTFVSTFLAVLALGVEKGILMGIAISFVLLIRASSKPNIAVVGRVGDSHQFRNVLRYDVRTAPSVLAVRVDESFYFVNTRYIERFLVNHIAESPEIRHVLLICHAANFIDTSGLEMLEMLQENLEEAGVTLHLAEVKGPVMDHLRETEFYDRMKGKIFFTTDAAMRELGDV